MSALVEMMIDTMGARMKKGIPLDLVCSELVQYLSEPQQRAAIEGAASHIRRKVAEIERLKQPTTLKCQLRTAWYPGPQDTDDFWPALRSYLLDVKGREESVVRSIDDSSTRVISCLDFPGSAAFSTRGLVVGYVQSGKTANYTAVISKAADAGFRVFLVLSGLTNSLRKQTQGRLDRELVRLQPKLWQTWMCCGRPKFDQQSGLMPTEN